MKQRKNNDRNARRAKCAKRKESDKINAENEKRFDRMFDQSFWPDVHSD